MYEIKRTVNPLGIKFEKKNKYWNQKNSKPPMLLNYFI